MRNKSLVDNCSVESRGNTTTTPELPNFYSYHIRTKWGELQLTEDWKDKKVCITIEEE